MRLNKCWLGAILLSFTAVTPLVLTGCAEHAAVRVYDPYYNDFHVWNDHEVIYYRQWVVETHRPYRDFRKLPPPEQRQYWACGTSHPVTARKPAGAKATSNLKQKSPPRNVSPAGL